jgi:acetyl esterase/lipase
MAAASQPAPRSVGCPQIQDLARELDIPIVTVEYRLAPETIWSGSLDDNYTALLWTVAHASDIGIDPTQIALMGESAGGGHAALLALAARDRGEVTPAFQCLIYPMIDDRSGTTRQVPGTSAGSAGTLLRTCSVGRASSAARPAGPRYRPPGCLRVATDLAGLPPTFIACGALDLFVRGGHRFRQSSDLRRRADRAADRARRLSRLRQLRPGAAISRRFRAAKLEALRRGLGLKLKGENNGRHTHRRAPDLRPRRAQSWPKSPTKCCSAMSGAAPAFPHETAA